MFRMDHYHTNGASIPTSLVGDGDFLEIGLLCSPSDIRAILQIFEKNVKANFILLLRINMAVTSNHAKSSTTRSLKAKKHNFR